MTFKKTLKVITIAAVYEYHLLSVANCYNISIYNRFRYTTTFPVYVIAHDIEKSFTIDNKVWSHNRFTALLDFVRDYLVEPVRPPER